MKGSTHAKTTVGRVSAKVGNKKKTTTRAVPARVTTSSKTKSRRTRRQPVKTSQQLANGRARRKAYSPAFTVTEEDWDLGTPRLGVLGIIFLGAVVVVLFSIGFLIGAAIW